MCYGVAVALKQIGTLQGELCADVEVALKQLGALQGELCADVERKGEGRGAEAFVEAICNVGAGKAVSSLARKDFKRRTKARKERQGRSCARGGEDESGNGARGGPAGITQCKRRARGDHTVRATPHQKPGGADAMKAFDAVRRAVVWFVRSQMRERVGLLTNESALSRGAQLCAISLLLHPREPPSSSPPPS
ncbi:hypothetical protein CYMTET_32270 [Cymbomonas tetramitiformis]|uniref:Uncharacterized protein n=1 Tax=Cymbomonas tetramitiformis TaxID=36881 RepID=A0AAE0FF40_9CHLO|nr:hypothetical protein CYMTET_32270 [Cymbomonas tetramitiformis]